MVKRGYRLFASGSSADGGIGLFSTRARLVVGLKLASLVVVMRFKLNVTSGFPCGVNGLAAIVACEFDCRCEAIAECRGLREFLSIATGFESGDTRGPQLRK